MKKLFSFILLLASGNVVGQCVYLDGSYQCDENSQIEITKKNEHHFNIVFDTNFLFMNVITDGTLQKNAYGIPYEATCNPQRLRIVIPENNYFKIMDIHQKNNGTILIQYYIATENHGVAQENSLPETLLFSSICQKI